MSYNFQHAQKTKLFLFLFFICVSVFLPLTVMAQENVTVDTENLNELIETLESDTSRGEFIQNLKTLKETSGEEEEKKGDFIVLSEALGLDTHAEELLDGYHQFLEDNNLKASFIGQIVLNFCALLGTFILLFLVRKGGVALRDKLLRVKSRYSLGHDRFRFYARCLRYSGYLLAIALFLYTTASIWNFTDFGYVTSDVTYEFFGNFINVVVVSLIAVFIWETADVALEYGIRKSTSANSSRLRTLLPIVKNVFFVAFALLFTLVMLSEFGIDIMPLLAGAGVLGIAIGFGAQTMVKDFLSGFTIILEDLVQVGDIIKISECVGEVEKITIRKIQLRDLDGTVYTVPFSEISIIENMTKDYSYYMMNIGVAYREDPDEVIGYLEEISEEMRTDDAWKNFILDDLEIFGLDQFADSAIIIKARLKTKPSQQWNVGREYNRRLKYKFDKHGIEIPYPHQTIYFGEDKQGKAPAAPIKIQETKKLEDKSDNDEFEQDAA
mgnify:FL=1|tara:strand:+ start:1678 stop:3165 length:1488 start_codon:yes stop_codon:yes gene_type:complete